MIETQRLDLRRPQLEDVDAVLELVGDDAVMRWLGGESGGRDLAQAGTRAPGTLRRTRTPVRTRKPSSGGR